MIYFIATVYSKHTYARFRSSQALDRFIANAHGDGHNANLRWAYAWQSVAQRYAQTITEKDFP